MTKWVLAANVGLLVPIVIAETPPATFVRCAITTLSLALGILAGATILKTQCSLRGRRLDQRKWRTKHPALAAADKIVRPKDGEKSDSHYSFCNDWEIWLPMLAISLFSSAATIVATVFAACAVLP